MNFIKLHTILSVTFLFSLAGLTSCENEPEVGSLLFPEDESAHVVKAYIDNYCFYPKNTMQSHLLQLGSGGALSGEDQSVELKVQLTHAATQDLTFSLVVDRTKFQPEDEETFLLGEDAVSFTMQKVTVYKGEQVSREAFSFSLDKESQSLKTFSGNGVLALALVSNDGVEIVPGYDMYVWKVTKEVSNIHAGGNLQGKTMIPVTDYDVLQSSYGEWSPTEDLSDGVNDNYSYIMFYSKSEGNNEFRVQFHDEQSMVGMTVTPFSEWGDWSLSCSKVELWGGEDENHLTRIGVAVNTGAMPTSYTPWEVVFFEPIKVKFLKIFVLDNFTKGSSQNVVIPEVRFYK